MNNWTEEKMGMMFQARNERIERHNEAMRAPEKGSQTAPRVVSNHEFFARHRIKVKKLERSK